jgi:hypothetical protein
MGSFGGVNIDSQNFHQTVNLAEQKALIEKQLKEQERQYQLAQSLTDYRNNLNNSTFPDGEYYVTSDFNSQEVRFQGDAYNTRQQFMAMPNPVLRLFKKGDLVNVVTFTKDMAMNTVKAIQTNSGTFYADQNKLSKTKPVEPVTTESLAENKKKDDDTIKVMIVGAFVLGFLLSND